MQWRHENCLRLNQVCKLYIIHATPSYSNVRLYPSCPRDKWQEYIMKPPCIPIKSTTILKSPMIFRLYFLNCTALSNSLTLSKYSLWCVEWAMGINRSLLSLCRNTVFKNLHKLSINNLHCEGTQGIAISSNSLHIVKIAHVTFDPEMLQEFLISLS